MAVAKHKAWLLALLLPMAVGCVHVIRPSVAVRYDDLAAMNRRPETIQLLITDEYENYVSRDRGHALADPQRYEVGPALAEITKRYFRASFCEVVVGTAAIPNGQVDFVVTPMIERFDNSLSLNALRHRFEIQLAALISSTETAESRRIAADQAADDYGIEEVRNERTGRGELIPAPTWRTGERPTEKVLGLAIQDAVRKLVQRVESELDGLQPATAPRSCPRG